MKRRYSFPLLLTVCLIWTYYLANGQMKQFFIWWIVSVVVMGIFIKRK